jgi:hypothetical protein
LVPIRIFGPSGQETRLILVDSGADDVVFPIDIASRIGVDLTGSAQGQAQGVGHNQPVALAFASVLLQLEDPSEVIRWRAVVAFTATPLRFPLLRIAGGLEHFVTTMNCRALQVQLIAHPSLPVTTALIP